MAMSMYAASVPVFQHMLRNLSHVLDKGEANAQARKFDPAVLTTARLAPDMLPLARQVLIACDAAKLGVARISGIEAPKFEDNEASFAELKARIQKTLDFLGSVPADAREKLDVAHRLLLSAVREFPEQNLPVPTNDHRGEGIAATHYELLMGVRPYRGGPDIVMYTTGYCPYCVAAKNFLKSRGATWTEVRVDTDPERRAEMMARAQRTSVPQIFIGDRHVGGFDDLYALEAAGKLDALLAG